MNSFVILVFIIFAWQGSAFNFYPTANSASDNYEQVSNTIGTISAALSQNIKNFADAISDISFSFFLKCLKITENGILDFKTLESQLNLGLSVNLTSIVKAFNIEIANDGTIDLKSVTQNFNLSNVDWTVLLTSLDIQISGGMLDFTSLAQKITTSGSLMNYLNKFSLESSDEDCNFTVYAQKYVGNAVIQEYDVITADGYIIKVSRVQSKNSCKVVLLSHGVLTTALDWIVRDYTSLVYVLVQNGYDVWVLNYRGTTCSRRHLFLNPDTDAIFWDYSFEELGYYDLRAVIKFILNVTGRVTLSLVGHSEGTTAPFVALSSDPELNKNIDVFVALSPVIGFPDCGFALKAMMTSGPVLNELLLALKMNELLAHHSLAAKLMQLCGYPGSYDVCVRVVIAAVSGYNPDNMEQAFTRRFFKCWPSGTSRKNLEHFCQIDISRLFRKFDYKGRNMEVYGTDSPPVYSLSKVTCKVVLMVGKNDKIVGVEGGKLVREKLPNVVDFFVVEPCLFTHVDFTCGRDAHQALYTHIVEKLNQHSISVC